MFRQANSTKDIVINWVTLLTVATPIVATVALGALFVVCQIIAAINQGVFIMAVIRFYDLSGGGYQKVDGKKYIYIQADDITSACNEFVRLFNVDPCNTTCDCCGPDYSITEFRDIAEATYFDRSDYDTREEIETVSEYFTNNNNAAYYAWTGLTEQFKDLVG